MCSLCEAENRGILHAPHTDAGAAPAAILGGAATSRPGAHPGLPEGLGAQGRHTLIKGGIVLSVDDAVGNFPQGDVFIENGRIVQVAPRIDAPDAAVIDAAGKIVMPGFIDTHHHQFETVLRSQLAHAILINDGLPVDATNYCKCHISLRHQPMR